MYQPEGFVEESEGIQAVADKYDISAQHLNEPGEKATKQDVLDFINSMRVANGAPALTLDELENCPHPAVNTITNKCCRCGTKVTLIINYNDTE